MSVTQYEHECTSVGVNMSVSMGVSTSMSACVNMGVSVNKTMSMCAHLGQLSRARSLPLSWSGALCILTADRELTLVCGVHGCRGREGGGGGQV